MQPSRERSIEIPAVNVIRSQVHQNKRGGIDSQKSKQEFSSEHVPKFSPERTTTGLWLTTAWLVGKPDMWLLRGFHFYDNRVYQDLEMIRRVEAVGVSAPRAGHINPLGI
jgi:hypothetical protein